MHPWIENLKVGFRDGDVALINPVALITIGFFLLRSTKNQYNWAAFEWDGHLPHEFYLSCN